MKDRIEVINSDKNIMPMIPVRDLVVFPGMTVHFEVGREMSMQSLINARDLSGGEIFLCAQKDVSVEDPEEKDLYRVGTVAVIRQLMRTPNGVYRCAVMGQQKAKLVRFFKHDTCFEAQIRKLPNYSRPTDGPSEIEALKREVLKLFETFVAFMPQMPKEIMNGVFGAKEPEDVFERIVFNIPLSFVDKQTLLEAPGIDAKLQQLMVILSKEIDILSLEQQIHEQVQNHIDENQRDYYLREQIKVLQSELGENFDLTGDDVQDYGDKIMQLKAPEEVRDKLLSEVRRLNGMAPGSPEAVVVRGYLDTVLGLPWGVYTEDCVDIKKAEKILEKDHYGLKKVKERILENIAVRSLVPDLKGQIICLVGPPGVGKTSVAKSVARALGRKFVRVSLGGVRDESDIRGHRKTYVGAMPGRILNGMKLAGSSNPVMLLDEIDKMSNDFRGDPSSAMLEVLDSEQNNAFRDHFAEVPFDLSSVLFITTANTLDTVAPPLLDRMEVIELSSYTAEEKFNIAKKHLVKKQMAKYGLTAKSFRITNDGIYKLIGSYTREAGVRNLEREIGALCRKAARQIVENGDERVTFNARNIPGYLGHERFKPDDVAGEATVGYVNGLAWTSVGGVVMPLEVIVLDGKGRVDLTGSLGEVMKESAKIGVSLCRSLAADYDIDPKFLEKSDLHIHAPQGAVPKDGPSAGVTMVTAIISALSGRRVRADVAMTGEITLHGKVLPIGGLREKTMAAYKAGMTTVIIPEDNRSDLDDVDETVKNGLEFVFAKDIRTVLDTALMPAENKGARQKLPLGMLETEPAAERPKLTV